MLRKDYMEFDTTPVNEKCVGVNDPHNSRLEYEAIKSQIIRQFGEPPEGVSFRFKPCQHDFGTYYQLIIYYLEDMSPESEEEIHPSYDYVLKVEGNFPQEWDEEAKKFLKEKGYSNVD